MATLRHIVLFGACSLLMAFQAGPSECCGEASRHTTGACSASLPVPATERCGCCRDAEPGAGAGPRSAFGKPEQCSEQQPSPSCRCFRSHDPAAPEPKELAKALPEGAVCTIESDVFSPSAVSPRRAIANAGRCRTLQFLLTVVLRL